MSPGLQDVVDSLSARLGRSVTIDDARLNVLAYSIVDGQVDPMRTDAILRRITPTASAAWLFSLGITRATRPVRLPGKSELGQLPRVCAPVRSRSVLLGYLWVIDESERLTDAELEVIDAEATFVGQLLYQDQLLEKLQRGKENELARDLLSESSALSDAAAAELADLGSFTSAGCSVVTVFQPEGSVPPDLRAVLAEALHEASRQFSPRHCLYLTRGREGLLLTTHAAISFARAQLPTVAAEVVRSVAGQIEVRAGIGEPVASLSELYACYRQACLAIRVARAVPTFGAVTSFPDLGVYRILATLPADQLTPDLLDAGLRTLLRDGPSIMTETLETYLDCACDSTRTAAALHIHRTTLHYRLGRIQQITGADLSDGTQRLTLHLGLKAARLSRHPLR